MKSRKIEEGDIERYVSDLKDVLMKEDVCALQKFIIKHKDVIGSLTAKMFTQMDFITKQITMYKMICNRTDMPTALKEKAREFLKEHNSSEYI